MKATMVDKIPANEALWPHSHCIIVCMSAVGCVVYNVVSLCPLFCVASDPFLSIITGKKKVSKCINQALVAHRWNTPNIATEEG